MLYDCYPHKGRELTMRLLRMRPMLVGLLIGILALGAQGLSNARPAYASTLPSNALIFYCSHTLDLSGNWAALDDVQVNGLNQYGNEVEKFFYGNVTQWDGTYWWFAEGRYISFTAYWTTGTLLNRQHHSAFGYWYVPTGYNGWILKAFVSVC